MANTQAGTIPQDMHCLIGTEISRDSSDQQLLEGFITRRDEAAFAGLVRRHGGAVWGVCRRVLHQQQDIEDAFQAVFLILARKAASIRKGEAVGSWLYGVAYRTAMKARQNTARRQQSQKETPPARTEPSASSEAACRELQRLLDEEVQRLGTKYRAPFVLCCLEGLSRAEAARELGCKEGTVSSRLAQARKLLQNRLLRRGVTLSAVLTAGALAQNAVAAAPAALIQSTISAVLAPLAGKAAVALSTSSVGLAESLIHTMFMTKLKATICLLLAMTTLVTGVSVAALQLAAPGGKPAAEPVAVLEPELFLPPPEPAVRPIDEQVLALAFSPDGKKLITAGAWWGQPGQIKIWDAATARELVSIRGIAGVRTVAFSPQGTIFATGDFKGAIKLRDASTGAERAAVKAQPFAVNGLTFSPDGAMLATAGLDRTVRLWSVKELQQRQVFVGHTDMVLSVAFFRHGQAIVSCGQDKTARIWDVSTAKEKFILSGHGSGVEMVAISPDDTVVATAGWDGTIRLWDAATGKEQAILKGRHSFHALAFSPDGSRLAGAGTDGTVSLWDLKSRQLTGSLQQHKQTVWSLAFSPDGHYLASGSIDTTARLWDMKAGKDAATLRTSLPSVQSVVGLAHAPDGKVLGIASQDGTAQILDARTGDRLFVLPGHTQAVTCLTFAPDGQTLATSSLDGTVKVWNRTTGKEKHTLKGHGAGVQALVFTADGKKLASAGDDKVIKIWDAELGKELATLKGTEAAIRALALSADGGSLLAGSADGTITVWDLAREKESRTLRGHEGSVRALAVSASGTVASSSEDRTVKVWDLAQAQESLTLRHPAEVWSLAFSPSGGTLVSGGLDSAVRMWDPVTGKTRGILNKHTAAVTALAVDPRGEYLISAGRDGSLLRWQRAVSALPELPLIFRQDFLNRNLDEQFLKYVPADAPKQCRVEAEGLRISLPGKKAKRLRTGFQTRFRVQGDFDITMSYELLQADRPRQGPGIGVRLTLVTNTPTRELLMLSRINNRDVNGYHSDKAATDAKGKQQVTSEAFATDARSGKLRLLRQGSVVTFLVAEQGFAPLRKLCERELGKEDLTSIRVVGDAGNADSPPLEVRLVDFEVRAGQASGAAPLAAGDRPVPGARPTQQSTVGTQKMPLAPPAQKPADGIQHGTGATPPDMSKNWLVTAVMVGVLVVCSFVALGLWLRRRQRRTGAGFTQGVQNGSLQAEALPAMSFACPDCGRKLKVRADLAGKKVKCARCGKAVRVPESHPGQSELTK